MLGWDANTHASGGSEMLLLDTCTRVPDDREKHTAAADSPVA